jgi:hypothetical protein
MINGMGLQGAFILLAFLGMAFWASSFIMIAYGKQFRRATAMSYWRLVEQQGLEAH